MTNAQILSEVERIFSLRDGKVERGPDFVEIKQTNEIEGRRVKCKARAETMEYSDGRTGVSFSIEESTYAILGGQSGRIDESDFRYVNESLEKFGFKRKERPEQISLFDLTGK